MKALEGRLLNFRYGGGPFLLKQANIFVKPGECVLLRGPSGAGKTTLAHILSGIIPRSFRGELTGDVFLFGENMKNLSLARCVEKVGVVWQNPAAQLFFPTVEDEIAFGPENLCLPREEIGRRIENALQAVGMSAYRRAETRTLSLGQKQLIAFAAALALEPKILILDEVFSQLDASAARRVKKLIRRQAVKGTAIFLIDNGEEGFELARRAYHLAGGQIREVPV